MGISLFEHNEAAYTAAVDLMSETGKAAIIHPTGTGKSFIAFKLCEDNPDKRICWLSPSEYIFKTQLENLKKTGAEAPQNIQFFTYAKLMYLSADEMREIQPDFIILDEFHRCGAEMWGKSVDALLAMYPAVPLLGLSATNIRYLDNQRDMADELFDGNVASEMTLGEAIVRGILNSPKYVLAVYSCRNDLEKYERKVRSARCMQAKKSGCLTNEQAEKLTDIGMRWQSLSDLSWETHFKAAKAYYVEHGNLMAPTADKYNGVYLGRWLAALRVCRKSGCMRNYRGMLTDERIAALDETGMIWDVPNYIWEQNYYAAVQYHKANGNLNVPTYYVTPAGIRLGEWLGRLRKAKRHPKKAESHITDEQVRKLDELGMNWDNLFLSVWNDFYFAACRYRKEHGNLDVPYSYRAADGCKLGQWISVQRRRHSKLSADRVKKLNAIGMRWEAVDRWERNFLLLKQYYEENGNIDIPRNYKINGFGIAVWLDEQKRRMRSETGRNCKSAVCLTPEQISRLRSLGVRPDISAADLAWERQYKKAKAFYDENKVLDSAETHAEECEKSIRLWLIAQRRKYRAGKTQPKANRAFNSARF